MVNTIPGKKVWEHIPTNADIHSYRADYATYMYKQYARPVEELNFKHKIRCADGKYKSELYICRGDERGKRLDRQAIGVISVALGHKREDTAIANYIQDI